MKNVKYWITFIYLWYIAKHTALNDKPLPLDYKTKITKCVGHWEEKLTWALRC